MATDTTVISPPLRILLADDHEAVRQGLRVILDGQPDMTVIGESVTGEQTLEQARALQPDIIVLDLSMPGAGGVPIAVELRRQRPETAIVVLTRHDDPAFVHQLLHAGVAAYVLKQSRSSELLRAIRVAAAGGRYLDPALPAREAAEPRRRPGTPRVTDREVAVLRMVAAGHMNKDIAAELGVTVKTVEVHKANAMRKLSLRGRVDVVRYAVLNGWLGEP